MRKALLLFTVIVVLLAGCTAPHAQLVPNEAPVSEQPGKADPAPVMEAVPETLAARVNGVLIELYYDQKLHTSWSGTPEQPEEFDSLIKFEMISCERVDGVLTATAELYNNIGINPETLEERAGRFEPVAQLAHARAVVQFRELGDVLEPISCVYEEFPQPALDYLLAKNEEFQAEIAGSETIDLSLYDEDLVDHVWRKLFATRFIESPADITLWDLEQYTGSVDLYFSAGESRLDASLLRLMPNLTWIDCRARLTDFAVFEDMHNLQKLTFNEHCGGDFKPVKVGWADAVEFSDPDFELLDLSGVNTDTLSLRSMRTAVNGFTGCEGIKNLYILSTRTEMKLINKATFPDLEYINLYLFSDYPHVRDFSDLATFGGDVVIDICLTDRACNMQTIESLSGVKMRKLFLTPNENFPEDIDANRMPPLDAEEIRWESDLYFTERSKESDW